MGRERRWLVGFYLITEVGLKLFQGTRGKVYKHIFVLKKVLAWIGF